MSKFIVNITQKFFEFLKNETNVFKHQITLFATLNFIGHAIFIWNKENYRGDTKGIILMEFVIIFFSIILIFHQYWSKKLLIYKSIIWHLFLIFTLPFYFSFMSFYYNTIEWQLNFLVALSFLSLLCNWHSFLIASIIGIIGSYEFYHNISNDKVIPDLYIIFMTSIIIIIYSCFMYRNARVKKLEYMNLSQQMDELNDNCEDKIKEKTIELKKDLVSRTALLQDVSHEIRSPLHGIMALSEILSREWDNIDQSERKKQISNIYEISSGLTKFINELLDFSKFRAGRMVFNFEKLNLIDIIIEVIEYCRKIYLFQKKITIKFDNKKINEAFIDGDKSRIFQLIMNLFINAIKYTEEGTIFVTLKSNIIDGKEGWEFSLIDQGIGIPDNETENIFIPFNQAARKNGRKVGTGLGLAACKQIVEAHNGKIWAENNKTKKGAKFTFIIPILKAQIT